MDLRGAMSNVMSAAGTAWNCSCPFGAPAEESCSLSVHHRRSCRRTGAKRFPAELAAIPRMAEPPKQKECMKRRWFDASVVSNRCSRELWQPRADESTPTPRRGRRKADTRRIHAGPRMTRKATNVSAKPTNRAQTERGDRGRTRLKFSYNRHSCCWSPKCTLR
jgi:hypothetical protein